MDQNFLQPAAPPKNWLVESILVTIFCCLPFGIAGIIFATQVNTKFAAGDYEGAIQASKDAGSWTKIGFFSAIILAVLCIILYVILVVVLGMSLIGIGKYL